MLDPAGRVAMISGASRGIGRAILERLLASGWQVSAGVRTPTALAASERLLVHRYDAQSASDPITWTAATMARFGRIDALVNAAGISAPRIRIDEADETALDQMWAVNVKGPLRMIRATLPHLKASGTGRVVNIASLSGKRVANENFAYALTKHAVMALTQSVRRIGFGHGIRASALCPGFVATDMTAHVTHVPRDTMTAPEDVAVLAEMLLLLPNTATIGELLVNFRVEPGL